MTPFHTVYIQENFKTSLKAIDKIISVHSCQVASRCCLEQLTKISQSLALSGSTLILLHDGILRTGSTRTLNDINKTEKYYQQVTIMTISFWILVSLTWISWREWLSKQRRQLIFRVDSPFLTPLLKNAAVGKTSVKILHEQKSSHHI